ncbi:MAG TPA: dTDP-4-dehydrorhamnose reductase [Rhabdochlamydiaceae bacterium]|nr:dTDP-4-dehydrorhamnose reductase [Rhabdochlamydiaceae bacterium]
MLIWILGSDGLLGKSMQLCLKQRQIPFFATNRMQADITQLELLKDIAQKQRPTHIINCAAYNHVDQAEKEPAQAYAVNAQGPENLGRLSAAFGIKIVHVSTDYVFDGEKKSPYLETDLCAPKNVYGASKREGEKKLLAVAPGACVVRTSWLFGKGGINFISKLPQLFLTHEELEVDAKHISRPTFCFDLAEALVEFLSKSGIFHYAGSLSVSRFQVAEQILKIGNALGLPFKCRAIKPLHNPTFNALRPLYSVLDISYIESMLKSRPRPLEETLKELLKDV